MYANLPVVCILNIKFLVELSRLLNCALKATSCESGSAAVRLSTSPPMSGDSDWRRSMTPLATSAARISTASSLAFPCATVKERVCLASVS